MEVTEPEWVPVNGEQLVPGSVTAKDPTAVNTGKNDAWIFLEVQVPVKTISVVDPVTRKKQEAKKTALFSYEVKEGWEMVEQSLGDDWDTYVYGYHEIVKPGEKTTELFEEVTLVNYLEGQLDETDTLTMPIEAMAIQMNVCAEGASLTEIYQQYLKQKAAEA